MQETSIYVLIDPRTGQVRYVGKTAQPLKVRLAAHVRRSKEKKTHRDCWIAGLRAVGATPLIEAVEVVSGDWRERERHWISAYLAVGAALTNQTEGGDGITGDAAKQMWTPERRAAQSIRTAEMNRSRKGTPWGDQRKAQQSESQLRRWARDAERQAHRERMTVVCADPQYREMQSVSVSASWTPERRQAQAAVARKVCEQRWGASKP